MVLSMGVNLTYIVHYRAPRSLEDYFQESCRGGELSTSTGHRQKFPIVETRVILVMLSWTGIC